MHTEQIWRVSCRTGFGSRVFSPVSGSGKPPFSKQKKDGIPRKKTQESKPLVPIFVPRGSVDGCPAP